MNTVLFKILHDVVKKQERQLQLKIMQWWVNAGINTPVCSWPIACPNPTPSPPLHFHHNYHIFQYHITTTITFTFIYDGNDIKIHFHLLLGRQLDFPVFNFQNM